MSSQVVPSQLLHRSNEINHWKKQGFTSIAILQGGIQ